MGGESRTMTYQNVTIWTFAALDAIEEIANMIARHPVALVTLLFYRWAFNRCERVAASRNLQPALCPNEFDPGAANSWR